MNSNLREVKKILWIILFANLVIALLKIIIGGFIKSASMMADGFHSLSDGASNVVGIVGISIAIKPKDREHPYGHRKFEILASMFIGAMLTLVGINIIIESIDRFKNIVEPSITIESLLILIFTLFINILVSKYEYKMGKKLNSHILIADSMHTKSDVFVSIGVLITLFGINMGLPPIIDPIVSVVVALFILHSAYEILISSIGVLVDKAIIDEKVINDIVIRFDEVKDVHKIRSRGSQNDIHIDMHVLVNPNLSTEEAHILGHKIEDVIRKEINENCQVIVHTEPYYNDRINV